MEDQPNYTKKVVGKDTFFIANGHTFDEKNFVWKLKSETIKTNHYFSNQGASMEKAWFLPGGGATTTATPQKVTPVKAITPPPDPERAIATLRHFISIVALTIVPNTPSMNDLLSALRMLHGIAGVEMKPQKQPQNVIPTSSCPLTAESLRHAVAGLGLSMTLLASCLPQPLPHPDIKLALRELTKAVYGAVPGKFVVTVVGCKDLESKDGGKESVGRFSDPYVVLTCGTQVFKTKTLQDNPNPSFDQKFTVTVDDVTTTSFKLVVMDADDHNSDDIIGSVVLQMPFEFEKSVWHALTAPAKKGTMCISVELEE